MPPTWPSSYGARRKLGSLLDNRCKASAKAVQDLKIELPGGQLTHLLRHTFAIHFMMNGDNMQVLQQILGHPITMTIYYAHFAPDHLEEATRFNPIAINA
ncbi:tyrosine-type recombinase/integrase [Halomonas sp. HNIBRBA4712]|uniref:tyrosine-type recombinase/integrase n=1 Tax=Halomonas sp. HNIBRBA4712 TaxID=3373087 RepID=UPI0037460030